MNEIVINKNGNYFRPILVITLMICMLYILIFRFLFYPAEHTYFLLRTKEIVVIFSIIGIITCLLVISLTIRSLFKKNNFLRIDSQGIFNGFFLYKYKFIRWDEIKNIETIKYNYNNYIAIFPKKVSNREKGLNRFFYKINELTMGTPYIIYSGDLDCSFSELEKNIMEMFLKYKKRTK